MKTAIYTNKATNEIYRLGGINNIGQAWALASVACNRMNWNLDMFSDDVKIKLA